MIDIWGIILVLLISRKQWPRTGIILYAINPLYCTQLKISKDTTITVKRFLYGTHLKVKPPSLCMYGGTNLSSRGIV